MANIRATSAALVVVAALGAGACSSNDDSASEVVAAGLDARSPDMAGQASPSDEDTSAEGRSTSDGAATAGSPTPAAPLGLDELGRAIAVEAGVTIATPDIRQAVDDTLAVVRRAGATVYNADVHIGDERDDGSVDGDAQIVAKVAPIGLDPLIADLDGVTGTLTGRTQTSDDVTDQLVDLDIRIRVERNTIERFEGLLAQATDFQDVVDIQRVISERTVALEQLLATQRSVEQRVELSTLTIDLQYAPPVEIAPDEATSDDGIADAFRNGWDAFVGAAFVVVFALAVTAPFLAAIALATIVTATVWTVRRRQRRRASAPTLGEPTPAVGGEDEVADAAVGERERRPDAGVGDHLR